MANGHVVLTLAISNKDRHLYMHTSFTRTSLSVVSPSIAKKVKNR